MTPHNNSTLSIANVERNINGGKVVLSKLLEKLRSMHKGMCVDINDCDCIKSDMHMFYDADDIKQDVIAIDMDLHNFNNIALFSKCCMDDWISLFSKCISLIDNTLDPIIGHYKTGNCYLTNYELEKAIVLAADICTDLYSITLGYPEYAKDPEVIELFSSYARFIKYLKCVNKCVIDDVVESAA